MCGRFQMNFILLIIKTLLIVTPLLLGGVIYILFRRDNIILFKWANVLGLSELINCMRNINSLNNVPNWIIYNLPDGLWLFSCVFCMSLLWRRKNKTANFWMLIMPLIICFHEVGQGLKLFEGTFDIMDLLFYLLSTILAITLSRFF